MGLWDWSKGAATTLAGGPMAGGAWLAGKGIKEGGEAAGISADGAKDFFLGKDENDFARSLTNTGYMQNYAKNFLNNSQTPMAGYTQLNGAQQAAARMQQGSLADRLQAIGMGTQKGAGEMAVDRQMGQAMAAQQAMARSARGSNAALAGRQMARTSADIGVAGAGQAAQAQLQDQAAANQQLGGVLGGMRGQDIDFAGQNAQLTQNVNLANQTAQFNQRQQQLQYLSQLLGIDQAELNAKLGAQQMAANSQGVLPGLLTAAGTVAGAVVGGPKGAQAGGAAGGAVGGAVGNAG